MKDDLTPISKPAEYAPQSLPGRRNTFGLENLRPGEAWLFEFESEEEFRSQRQRLTSAVTHFRRTYGVPLRTASERDGFKVWVVYDAPDA